MTATRLCACCWALCLVLAAQTDPPQNRRTKKQERQLRKELQGPYYIWLTRDVAYIITDEERLAFKRLQNDEEREQFVEQFWLRRDPTPDTAENEFKEEHYRRIAYANERFASGIEGWRTERGRVYITFGPPDDISDRWSRVEGRELRIRSRPGAIASSKALEPTSRSCLSIPRLPENTGSRSTLRR